VTPDGEERQIGDEGPAQAPPLGAVCGLFCEACSIYIASREDPDRLALIAAGFGQAREETYCEGCRAGRRALYCRSCKMFACAAEQGLAFCGECSRYPCTEIEAFAREYPHRAHVHEDLRRIRDVGPEAWIEEARRRYACPTCGTINSAYDLSCRRCGREPANAFVEEHREAIVRRLSRR
jgi:hypothetical protein